MLKIHAVLVQNHTRGFSKYLIKLTFFSPEFSLFLLKIFFSLGRIVLVQVWYYNMWTDIEMTL